MRRFTLAITVLLVAVIGMAAARPARAMGSGQMAESAAAGPVLMEKRLLGPGFVFPFAAGSRYQPYYDDYGAARGWNPGGADTGRRHAGIDILADTWTPLVAVADGVIAVKGWNQYGGWRLHLRPDAAPEYRIYYAHLAGFAKGLRQGAWVRAGQVIGYVGSTGYGPPGTSDKMVPHLHLGIYKRSGDTINPYPFLRQWEGRRTARSARGDRMPPGSLIR